ncbi:transcription initiation factor TFIIE subunit alpha [Microdochium nivale]|nr:transcription initiation factor TFIIE subunit alpha [Microdochium nivale]
MSSSAMDLAQTLLRSVVRAFYRDKEVYDMRHILIVDALVLHSALRDDDLGYLMSMNLKDLHKICATLKEQRFIAQHVRPEIKEGQAKPSNRTYYYIDYREAIDGIKWRAYTVDKAVQGNAVPAQEKKEYFCRRCKSEWTQMEVLDNVAAAGFVCHRCDAVLVYDPDRQAGGHEQSTRLNNQLKFITELLPRLDEVVIPDNTFEVAHSHARPVERDHTNQVAKSTVVEGAKPTAVRGMANTGPRDLSISITDKENITEEEAKAELDRQRKIKEANALPVWHVQSTVTGLAHDPSSTDPTASAAGKRENGDDEDDKLFDDNKVSEAEQARVDDVFALLAKQQQEEASRRAAEEEEDDDDEEEDDEDDEFEDVAGNAGGAKAVSSSAVPPSSSAAAAGGSAAKRGPSSLASGTTSAADTPVSSDDRPAKKVKVEEPAEEEDSDEEEDVAFEDV